MTDPSSTGVDKLLSAARSRLQRVAPEDLASAVAAGALLIDIRPEATRIAEGTIGEAIAVERNVLEWRLDPTGPDRIPQASDPERPVVLICNEGYQSSLAAAVLQDLGRRTATDLIGGYRGWLRAQGAEATKPTEPPEAHRGRAGG